MLKQRNPVGRSPVRGRALPLAGCVAGVAAAWAAAAPPVRAYTVTLLPASPKTVYLQVGVGTFTGGNYNGGGQGARNTTVNTVSLSLAPTLVGNGVAQTMTTDSTAANSFLDGYAFCNLPNQLYIGGFYRTALGNTAAAQVVATVPANLVSTTGATIPFSQIRWTASGNGDGNNAQPFPSAGFAAGGGQQTVGRFSSNQWAESCWTFSYQNTVVPGSGVYTGTVTYTVTTP